MKSPFDIRDPKSIDAFMDWYLSRMRHTFMKKGYYIPHACVFTMKDHRGLTGGAPTMLVFTPEMAPETDDWSAPEKDAFVSCIRGACERFDAFAVVFSSEAWAVRASIPEAEEMLKGRARIPIADNPDRVEVLFATFEHVSTAETLTWQAEITRDEKGEPSALGSFVKGLPNTLKVGRFQDVLRPVKMRTN